MNDIEIFTKWIRGFNPGSLISREVLLYILASYSKAAGVKSLEDLQKDYNAFISELEE